MNPQKNILLVDDDPLLTKLYETTLKGANYEVRTASSGEVALTEIGKNKPDLIFLDIMMPKMTGIELLKKIKEDQSNQGIKVIILTNVAKNSGEAKIAQELGADDYLIKSDTSLKELVDKAQGAIGNKQIL